MPALVLAAVLWRPIWDVDIFWQLKLGELILANRGPVLREPFAVLHLGEPLPAFAWAGQAIMALVRLLAGWSGLRLFNALCWAGGFWLAAAAAVRRGATRESAALAPLPALLVAVPGASLRPQSFALLCFGALLWLIESRGPVWRRSAAIALLLVLWQNLHPSAAVALAWLGALAAQAWWQRWRCNVAGREWEFTALTLAAGVALFITPDGFGFLKVAASNTALSQALRITEWLPLWAPENRLAALVLAPIAALTGGLLWRRADADRGLVLPWVALLVLSVLSARLELFWAISLVPVLAAGLPRLSAPAVRPCVAPALVGLSGLALIAVQPTRFRETIPVAQLARLHQAGVKGTIFAHFPWGGAVLDRGYPDWRVALDGRYYRYGLAEWNRYLGLAAGRPGLEELERVYHPAAFVLDPQWTPGLIAELRAAPSRWRQFSADRTAVIFVPAAPVDRRRAADGAAARP